MTAAKDPTSSPVLPAVRSGHDSGIRGRGAWTLAFERLRRDRAAVVAAATIVAIVAVAILAPLAAVITGHAPYTQYRDLGLSPSGVPVGPNSTFLFGTDGLGRDIFVRVVYGTRISLLVGVMASTLAVPFGTVVGITSGWFGGAVDAVLSRMTDIVLSLPFLVFSMAVVAVVGPSLAITIAAIAFFSWASVARVVRAQTLSLREREYVGAALVLGASHARVMFVEILPNVAATVIVYLTLLVPSAIAFEATMSFLGLGVVPPTPSWGNMLADGIAYYKVAWWFIVFPGAALVGTTLAFNVLGDSVRDAFDPRHDRAGLGRRRGRV